MKTIPLILILLAVFCGCALAEPPAHKDRTDEVTANAPAGPPITGLNFYGAHHSDTSWTWLKTVDTTNGVFIKVVFTPATNELYTATSTNKFTGQESDYAPGVNANTNSPLVIPVVTVTPK